MEEKQPFHVHCGDCKYEWIPFFFPVFADLLKKFNHTHCPYCHGKKVFIGKAITKESQ